MAIVAFVCFILVLGGCIAAPTTARGAA